MAAMTEERAKQRWWRDAPDGVTHKGFCGLAGKP